jgi:hypothetical protein
MGSAAAAADDEDGGDGEDGDVDVLSATTALAARGGASFSRPNCHAQPSINDVNFTREDVFPLV